MQTLDRGTRLKHGNSLTRNDSACPAQALGFSQHNGRRGNSANPFAGNFLTTDDADIIQNAQSATHAGHRSGRQHVIRT